MSHLISDQWIQQLKQNISFLEIASEHIVLKKAGTQYVGLCPFHTERTPSFFVHPTKQLFHCYGCKAGGDLIRFIEKIYACSFTEAIEILAERAHLPLPRDWTKKQSPFSQSLQKTAWKLTRFAASFYHQVLLQNHSAQNYLKKRHISHVLTQTYYLGWAPSSFGTTAAPPSRSLLETLKRQKAPLELAQKIGLIRKKGACFQDTFQNRLTFPFLDIQNRVCGFGARTLTTETHIPKYLNSPESFLFQKSKLLFGLPQARKHIREKNRVLVVEGYFDVLALAEAGWKETVSCSGTAFSIFQLKQLYKLTPHIFIIFDGDSAGEKASYQALLLGLEHQILLKGVFLPQADPAEWIQSGKTQVFQSLLNQNETLLDLILKKEIKHALNHSLEHKEKALKNIRFYLQKLKDPLLLIPRLQWLSQALGYSMDLLQKMFRLSLPSSSAFTSSLSNSRSVKAKDFPPPPSSTQSFPPPEDLFILRFLMQTPDFTKWPTWFLKAFPEPRLILSKLFSHPLSQALAAFSLSHPCLCLSQKQALWAQKAPPALQTLGNAFFREAFLDQNHFSELFFQKALFKKLRLFYTKKSQALKTTLLTWNASQSETIRRDKIMQELLDVRRKIEDFNKLYDKIQENQTP